MNQKINQANTLTTPTPIFRKSVFPFDYESVYIMEQNSQGFAGWLA